MARAEGDKEYKDNLGVSGEAVIAQNTTRALAAGGNVIITGDSGIPNLVAGALKTSQAIGGLGGKVGPAEAAPEQGAPCSNSLSAASNRACTFRL